MNDSYLYAIVALLPLSAFMLIIQTNPYYALVIQGIVGAIAALVFAVLGAPDVALTQALVGTLLAITLYAIAVRSSLVMRLGVLEDGAIEADRDPHFGQLINDLRAIFGKHYMRLELVPYTNPQALHRALMEKEVHATCARLGQNNQDYSLDEDQEQPYHTTIRVRRIYDILQTELSLPTTNLTYINEQDSGEEKH